MLNLFMLPKGGRQRGGTIRRSKRVKNTDINETSLRTTTPETVYSNIQASRIKKKKKSIRKYNFYHEIFLHENKANYITVFNNSFSGNRQQFWKYMRAKRQDS